MSSYRKLFLQHVAQTSEFPLGVEVSRAEGMYIYDPSGKRYLDFDSGISVSSLGHCYPDVVEAVQRQAAQYMHTMVYGEHIQTPQVAYAQLLSETLNNGLDSIYYTNCGSESVEVALKLARKATGRIEIMSCKGSYHGSTIAAESLRSDLEFTRHFIPGIPGVRNIEFNNTGDLSKITSQTACVIVEPIQGEHGIIPANSGYLQAIRQRCDETGALMILDEIQTGFGRTGYMFALQKYGVVPDILLIAKAMGGGMPTAGVVGSQSLMAEFSKNPSLGHITTFGGHPVCIAAALATLRVLLATDYISQVESKERLFRSLLVHPLINSIRSAGLMMAVELIDAELLSPVIRKCIENGVLTDYFLFDNKSFRIAPPLIISEEEIREGVSIIIDVLNSLN